MLANKMMIPVKKKKKNPTKKKKIPLPNTCKLKIYWVIARHKHKELVSLLHHQKAS